MMVPSGQKPRLLPPRMWLRLKTVIAQQPRQDEGVGVGAMGRQIDQRVLLVECLELRASAVEIGVDGPGPGMQRAETVVEGGGEGRALDGDDFFQPLQRLGGDLVHRQTELARESVPT